MFKLKFAGFRTVCLGFSEFHLLPNIFTLSRPTITIMMYGTEGVKIDETQGYHIATFSTPWTQMPLILAPIG